MEELVGAILQVAIETAGGALVSRSASSKVISDTPEQLVIEWRLPPGAEDVLESLERDRFVTPRTDGKLSMVTWQGDAEQELKAGTSFVWRAAYVHRVKNVSPHEVVFETMEKKH